jgi:glycosyltransferase involved in cell wall biosynthesis
VAFACAWWHPRAQTWSYTATRLRTAIGEVADVTDIEAQRSLPAKIVLRTLYGPRRGVPWQYSRIERRLLDRTVRRGVEAARPDAVLAIGEVDTPSDAPTFLYQDTNVAAVLATGTAAARSNLLPSSDALLRARAGEQIGRLQRAAGIFAMSRWFADQLAEHQGVPRDRILVRPPGMNNPPRRHRDPDAPVHGRLLFVGTDFLRKGGDQVVAAVARLRAGGDRTVRLTVAGPAAWPLAEPPPDFVEFTGRLGPQAIANLYATHDMLVMPSRFEAFGIVFAEALVAGLPCVARRAFAMPEIVEDGVTGALVESDDPDELAAAIASILDDRDVHGRVASARAALTARYSWSAAAEEIVAHMAAVTG